MNKKHKVPGTDQWITEGTRVIDMDKHNGWGDRISWFNFEKRSISGHMQNKPKVGDVMICEFESGRVGAFTFTEVKPCRDPRDMFFGTVQDLGYADEIETIKQYKFNK